MEINEGGIVGGENLRETFTGVSPQIVIGRNGSYRTRTKSPIIHYYVFRGLLPSVTQKAAEEFCFFIDFFFF